MARGSVRNKRNRWMIDYYHQGKRIREVVSGDKKEAEAILNEILTKLKREELGLDNVLVSQRRKGVTFEAFAERYLKWAKDNVKPNTFIRKRKNIKKLSEVFEGKVLCAIDATDIEAFKEHRKRQVTRKGTPVAPVTTNRDLQCLRHMFNMAVLWKELMRNPMEGVRLFKEEMRPYRILEDHEEEALLETAEVSENKALWAIIVTALDTGMGNMEVLTLKWSQINFRRKEMQHARSKTGMIVITPLTDRLYKTLRDKRLGTHGEYVFEGKREGKPLTSFHSSWYTALKRANLKLKSRGHRELQGFRFYDNRHTFGSRLATRGADLVTVKELMGHTDIKMTQRYLHSSGAHKRSAIDLLEDGHQTGTDKKQAIR